jgi:hypothetical protein
MFWLQNSTRLFEIAGLLHPRSPTSITPLSSSRRSFLQLLRPKFWTLNTLPRLSPMWRTKLRKKPYSKLIGGIRRSLFSLISLVYCEKSPWRRRQTLRLVVSRLLSATVSSNFPLKWIHISKLKQLTNTTKVNLISTQIASTSFWINQIKAEMSGLSFISEDDQLRVWTTNQGCYKILSVHYLVPLVTNADSLLQGGQTFMRLCEISSSHGGEYDVQSCLLGCSAVVFFFWPG